MDESSVYVGRLDWCGGVGVEMSISLPAVKVSTFLRWDLKAEASGALRLHRVWRFRMRLLHDPGILPQGVPRILRM